MRTALIGGCGLFVAFLTFTAVPVHAQVMSREAITLRNQILEVQNELNQLQREVEANRQRGGSALGGSYSPPASQRGASNDLVVNLLQQVSSLQDQVRDLRGKVDELTNSTDRKLADLDKKVSDLAFQFGLAQGKGGTPPAGATAKAPAAPTLAAPAPAARPSAGVLLQRGETALTRADYATAAANAQDILRVDAHSPIAYQAQFLLARALFGDHQYTHAALAYDDTYSRAPSGQHAEASLLGLASSLARIKQSNAACAALAKLHKQFPHLSSGVNQGAEAVAREARCS